MQYAIGLAVKTYLDLLDNEDNTPAYRFRFQWEQNNQLPGIELAQAQSLVEYADNNWTIIRQGLQASSDSGSSSAEDGLYLQLPIGSGVPYAWSQDADDDAATIGLTVSQLISRGSPELDWQVIVMNANPILPDATPIDIDLDPDDGIDDNKVDFVGVLIHELGHHLGFVSAQYEIENEIREDSLTLWDVFRVGVDATDGNNVAGPEFQGARRELRPDVDSWGVTALGMSRYWPLNSQLTAGNVGHWKNYQPSDEMYVGIMDSAQGYGSVQKGGSYLHLADIKALDILWYDIDDTGIQNPPEPAENVEPEPDEVVAPESPIGLQWDIGSNGSTQHVFVFRIDSSGDRVEAYSERNLSPSASTAVIPADTLTPGGVYEWFVTTANWRGFAYSQVTSFVAEGSTPCVADTNGDGQLSPADFSAWIAAFNAMAPECDQNGDSICTPADFSAWIANYNAGC